MGRPHKVRKTDSHDGLMYTTIPVTRNGKRFYPKVHPGTKDENVARRPQTALDGVDDPDETRRRIRHLISAGSEALELAKLAAFVPPLMFRQRATMDMPARSGAASSTASWTGPTSTPETDDDSPASQSNPRPTHPDPPIPACVLALTNKPHPALARSRAGAGAAQPTNCVSSSRVYVLSHCLSHCRSRRRVRPRRSQVNVPDMAVCLECGDGLRGLSEPRCPECSRTFDPDDLDFVTGSSLTG